MRSRSSVGSSSSLVPFLAMLVELSASDFALDLKKSMALERDFLRRTFEASSTIDRGSIEWLRKVFEWGWETGYRASVVHLEFTRYDFSSASRPQANCFW